MHGNVYEWCQGTYQTYAVRAALGGILAHTADVQPVKDSVSRVLRGGTVVNQPGNVRSAFRGRPLPGVSSFDVGFRPARTYP